MIKVVELVKGEIKDISINKYKIDQNLSWVDCHKPSKEELEQISDKTKIDINDLNVSLDPDARPRVVEGKNYSLILFAAPSYKEKEIKTATFAVFLFKKDVITIRNAEIEAMKKIEKMPYSALKSLLKKDSAFFVYSVLNNIIGEYFQIMDKIEEEIDLIEDEVIENPNRKLLPKIFQLKKTLIFFHKSLSANREVITAIEREYVTEFDKESIRQFRELYEDTVQLIDLEGTYRDILTGNLDMYLSSISNNLNQIMKTLTIITAFVMIPTLIAGIYGMNFAVTNYNMPELYWRYGYFWALGIMVGAVFLMYLYFRRKGWIG